MSRRIIRTPEIGAKAILVGDLTDITFTFAGHAWTLDEAVVHGPGTGTNPRGEKIDGWIVELRLDNVPLPGVRHVKDHHRLRRFVRHVPDMDPYGVHLCELGVRSTSPHFRRIAIGGHNPICPQCETLWPCTGHEQIKAERRASSSYQPFEFCHHCGYSMGGMEIRFPVVKPPPLDIDDPAVLAAVVTLEPGGRAAASGEGRDVVFHGKRGPCENAAYRYAREHGWELPAKGQPRKTRNWHIVARPVES